MVAGADCIDVMGLLGTDDPVLVDVEATDLEVHGYAKQGVGFGYSGLRGSNALLARCLPIPRWHIDHDDASTTWSSRSLDQESCQMVPGARGSSSFAARTSNSIPSVGDVGHPAVLDDQLGQP